MKRLAVAVSVLALCVVTNCALAQEDTTKPAEQGPQEQAEILVEEALVHGYNDGDIASCVRQLDRAAELVPADGAIQVRLSKALLTIGEFEAGLAAANRALELTPMAGGAHFAKAQGLLLTGDSLGAQHVIRRALEDEAIEMRPSDRGALSLTLVGLLMRAGNYEDAAHFLESQRPSLQELAEQPLPETVDDIGSGWHAIAAYAHVLTELEQPETSQRILTRFAPLNEEYIVERNAGAPTAMDYWNLAATGAGRIVNDSAITFLERAYAGGFVLSWRYNFAQHPTLWPLRGHKRFDELLRALDAEMARQRTSLGQQ